MTERFRRPNFGTLEIAITVDDPRAHTRPWTVTVEQAIVVDTDMLDAASALLDSDSLARVTV